MQDSKLRSRLKAQLTKFSSELCEGLSRPLQKFVGQMLFGIQASQDVKLSNVARSLKEQIPLIKTEDRLSRNLKAVELAAELTPQLAAMASHRVSANTVLCLDLSDIRKEYAKKMEYLAPVHDGSTGEVHAGYWLCDITGAEVNGSEIVPLYQKLYSAEAPEFTSENAEVLYAYQLAAMLCFIIFADNLLGRIEGHEEKVLTEIGQMEADLGVRCSQCSVPASVLVWACTSGQSPSPRKIGPARGRNSINVKHRGGHDRFDEFFERPGTARKSRTNHPIAIYLPFPCPSRTTITWLAATSWRFSINPLGQRISSRSTFAAGPSPKCTRRSLCEAQLPPLRTSSVWRSEP